MKTPSHSTVKKQHSTIQQLKLPTIVYSKDISSEILRLIEEQKNERNTEVDANCSSPASTPDHYWDFHYYIEEIHERAV